MSQEQIADLHVHTKNSPDVLHTAKYTIEEAIETAASKGLTAVAITEHGPKLHNYDSSQAMADRAGIILIPGVELRAIVTDGLRARAITKLFGRQYATVDILAYGVTEVIPERELSLEALIEEIHRQDGLAIIAHPSFAPGLNWYSPLGRQLITDTGADGIESFNAAVLSGMNVKARMLADSLEMPVTGGSDTRVLNNIGKGVTVFSPELKIANWQDCLNAIKSGKTTSRGASRKLGPSFVQ
jgi:predicted metal-dependent phosphoesterase TrpH